MKKLVSKIYRGIVNRYRSAHWKLTNAIHRILLRRLRLSHKFSTGIEVKISSYADWGLYNDIFVDGEYDDAIRTAFKNAKGRLRILDLGANVGLFLKRLLHIRRSEFPQIGVDVICVEGAPETFQILKHEAPSLLQSESVQMLQGLAGQKSGSAYLSINAFHAMTSITRHNRQKGVKVDYVDLSMVVKDWEKIGLLKCDIEGAEQAVFENYQDVLSKTELATVEFHLDRVDRDLCLTIALNCGLNTRRVCHENTFISVELLAR